MTPADYTAALARLGLTHAEAAKLFGYTRQTSHNYGSGRKPIPPFIVVLLKIVEHMGVDRTRLVLSSG